MKHTKEELIKALKVIQDECKESNCIECPFGSREPEHGTRCKLRTDDPEKWRIDKQEVCWRALH